MLLACAHTRAHTDTHTSTQTHTHTHTHTHSVAYVHYEIVWSHNSFCWAKSTPKKYVLCMFVHDYYSVYMQWLQNVCLWVFSFTFFLFLHVYVQVLFVQTHTQRIQTWCWRNNHYNSSQWFCLTWTFRGAWQCQTHIWDGKLTNAQSATSDKVKTRKSTADLVPREVAAFPFPAKRPFPSHSPNVDLATPTLSSLFGCSCSRQRISLLCPSSYVSLSASWREKAGLKVKSSRLSTGASFVGYLLCLAPILFCWRRLLHFFLKYWWRSLRKIWRTRFFFEGCALLQAPFVFRLHVRSRRMLIEGRSRTRWHPVREQPNSDRTFPSYFGRHGGTLALLLYRSDHLQGWFFRWAQAFKEVDSLCVGE